MGGLLGLLLGIELEIKLTYKNNMMMGVFEMSDKTYVKLDQSWCNDVLIDLIKQNKDRILANINEFKEFDDTPPIVAIIENIVASSYDDITYEQSIKNNPDYPDEDSGDFEWWEDQADADSIDTLNVAIATIDLKNIIGR